MSMFLRKLRRFWLRARDQLDRDHHRTLSFGDYVVDRWEKARILGFGEGSSIYDSAIVIGAVAVGANTWIGPGALLDGSGGLSIGSNCSVSAGVQIYSHDSVKWAVSGGIAPYERAPTTIGDRCYIGPNAVIGKGVTIGEGAIIGALSVVLCDVAPGAKVAGAPAKPIPQR